MTWGNPWAWAGLLTIALPILIHLFARHRARTLRFPTLRFVPSLPLLPTRRTRLTDPLLLLLRCAILLCAVAALARPVLSVRHMSARGGVVSSTRTVAHAIIVDTSASISNATSTGALLPAALRVADSIAGVSASSRILRTAAPASALTGAALWLAAQPGMHEVDVVSSFPAGALDGADLAAVPTQVGIRLLRVGVPDGATARRSPSESNSASVDTGRAAPEWTVRAHDKILVARAAPGLSGTTAIWSAHDTTAARDALIIMAPDSTRARAEAARDAAYTTGSLPLDAGDDTLAGGAPAGALAHDAVHSFPIAVTFPGFIANSAQTHPYHSIDQPAMLSFVARLRSDKRLADAAANASVVDESTAIRDVGIVIARTKDGAPAAIAVADSANGRARAIIVSMVAPGTLASAALIAATLDAAAPVRPDAARLAGSIPDSALRRMERPATPGAAAGASADTSTARILWTFALILIAIEEVVRHRARRNAEMSVDESGRELNDAPGAAT